MAPILNLRKNGEGIYVEDRKSDALDGNGPHNSRPQLESERPISDDAELVDDPSSHSLARALMRTLAALVIVGLMLLPGYLLWRHAVGQVACPAATSLTTPSEPPDSHIRGAATHRVTRHTLVNEVYHTAALSKITSGSCTSVQALAHIQADWSTAPTPWESWFNQGVAGILGGFALVLIGGALLVTTVKFFYYWTNRDRLKPQRDRPANDDVPPNQRLFFSAAAGLLLLFIGVHATDGSATRILQAGNAPKNGVVSVTGLHGANSNALQTRSQQVLADATAASLWGDLTGAQLAADEPHAQALLDGQPTKLVVANKYYARYNANLTHGSDMGAISKGAHTYSAAMLVAANTYGWTAMLFRALAIMAGTLALFGSLICIMFRPVRSKRILKRAFWLAVLPALLALGNLLLLMGSSWALTGLAHAWVVDHPSLLLVASITAIVVTPFVIVVLNVLMIGGCSSIVRRLMDRSEHARPGRLNRPFLWVAEGLYGLERLCSVHTFRCLASGQLAEIVGRPERRELTSGSRS